MKENKWIRLLAYVTGLVNQELLLQNEYLAAEKARSWIIFTAKETTKGKVTSCCSPRKRLAELARAT